MAWRTSAAADEDIAGIEVYGTVTFGRQQAAQYVDDLFATLDVIATVPRIARERSEIRSRARLYPFRAHNIFYVVDGRDILILRVLGHRQDWQNLL